MKFAVATRILTCSILAICFYNTSTRSAEAPAIASATSSNSSNQNQQNDPLLNPERVPEGVVIEYGSRYYWHDERTGKVFWAQKTFLQALAAEAAKSQPSVTAGTGPGPEAESAAEPPITRNKPACRTDSASLNAADLMKSAAQIQSNVGVCGGARIAGDLVITNGHCVIGPNGGWSQAKSIRNRQSNVTARFIVNGKAHSVRCGTVLAISPFQKSKGGRDFAVLRCNGIPDDVPVMRVTEKEPLVDDKVALATWDWPRRGVPSRISTGPVLQNDNSYLAARLKIIDGNSGSMIVNEKHEICGVANGAGFGPAAGAAFFHSMKEILRQVREQSPETYEEITEATSAADPQCVASVPAIDTAQRGVQR